jgi:abortive infection bacteriophage resistance protein
LKGKNKTCYNSDGGTMRKKSFKNLDEQIRILKSKGMIITDEEYTKDVLLRENYFFLNGYRHVFYVSDKERRYIKGTTFEELYSLFLFDRKLRNILFRYLLVAENNFKSVLSYLFSRKYGYDQNEYLKPSNFTSNPEEKGHVADVIRKMKRQIIFNGKKHTATEHYIKNYGYIPLWVLVKVLSFGLTADMFSVLKEEDRKEISTYYRVSPNNLDNYFVVLSIYRNLCAHEDIVFDYKTQRCINDTIYHDLLKIKKDKDGYVKGKNDILAVLIVLKQILVEEDFLEMMDNLSKIINDLKSKIKIISFQKIIDRMGLPENWEKLKDMKVVVANEK